MFGTTSRLYWKVNLVSRPPSTLERLRLEGELSLGRELLVKEIAVNKRLLREWDEMLGMEYWLLGSGTWYQ